MNTPSRQEQSPIVKRRVDQIGIEQAPGHERHAALISRMEACAELLDTYVMPELAYLQYRMPFGRFSDGTLTTVIERDAGEPPVISLGHRASPASTDHTGNTAVMDQPAGFYATRSTSEASWRSNGQRQYSDERVARMLDANWPSFSVDNTRARNLTERHHATTFTDLQSLIDEVIIPASHDAHEQRCFIHQWQFDSSDARQPLTAQASLTTRREQGEYIGQTLELQLPFRYRNELVMLACTVTNDRDLGSLYAVSFTDPATLEEMSIEPAAMDTMVAELSGALDRMMEAKVIEAYRIKPTLL